jgi:hypothetical protein
MNMWPAQSSVMDPWGKFFRLMSVFLLLAPPCYGIAFIVAHPGESLAWITGFAVLAYDFIRIFFPLLIFLFMFIANLFLQDTGGSGEFCDGGLESGSGDYGYTCDY